jgi:hypothetical protein
MTIPSVTHLVFDERIDELANFMEPLHLPVYYFVVMAWLYVVQTDSHYNHNFFAFILLLIVLSAVSCNCVYLGGKSELEYTVFLHPNCSRLSSIYLSVEFSEGKVGEVLNSEFCMLLPTSFNTVFTTLGMENSLPPTILS